MLAHYRVGWPPRPLLRVVAVALFGLALLTTPLSGLAGQFLTIFRVRDFQPITVPTRDQGLYRLPDLTMLGDMAPAEPGRLQPMAVADLATASAAVGFAVRTPASPPPGLEAASHRIAVSPAQTVTFTFRADKARAYLDRIGQSGFSLPARFDGAAVRVNVPAVAMLTYARVDAPDPAVRPAGRVERQPALASLMGSVVLMEARTPTVEASGVTFDELRDFLLTLPGLPAETAAQIRAIGGLSSTLPVPVPSGASARRIQVNGAPGLIVADPQSRLAGGLLWQRDDVVYALGGGLNEADLLSLAGSLR